VQSAEHKDHVWCWDFLFDRTAAGSPLKWLSIIDEYMRECLTLKVDRSITAEDVIDTLAELFAMRGVPRAIRSDNGPEFVARAPQPHPIRSPKHRPKLTSRPVQKFPSTSRGMQERRYLVGARWDSPLDYTHESMFEVCGDRLSDFDASGVVDNDDIVPFVAALIAPGDAMADVNLDGTVDNEDIVPFVGPLPGAPGPAVPEPNTGPLAACGGLAAAWVVGRRRARQAA
jgi:Integrase core domain